MFGILALSSLLWAQSPADLVSQTFGQQPADFIFLVDSSQGVLTQSQELVAPITALIQQLPDRDRVALLAYHTRTSEVVPMQTLTPEVRADMVARLPKIALPSANESDLGAVVAAATNLISRNDAARLVYVVVVTDFCHAPSVQSPYDGGGRDCRAMRGSEGLSTAWKQATAGRTVKVVYLPIPGATGQKPDELKAILGNGEAPPGAVEWLSAFAKDPSTLRYGPIAQEWFKQALVQATVEGEPEGSSVQIHLALPRPLQGELQNLKVEGGTVSSEAVLLNPDSAVEVTLTLPPPPFTLLSSTQELELPVKLSGDLRLVPATAWSAVGLEPERGKQEWTVPVTLQRRVGSPAQTAVLGLSSLAALGLGGLVVRNRLMRRNLGGSWSWRKGMEPRQPLSVASQQQANIVILPDGSLGHGSSDTAILIIKRTSATNAFVEIKQEGVEINTRKVGKGKHPIVPGATSFQIGEYRLTWE